MHANIIDLFIDMFLNLNETVYVEHLRQILANNNGSKCHRGDLARLLENEEGPRGGWEMPEVAEPNHMTDIHNLGKE